MNIVEAISSKGVKSTNKDLAAIRMTRPRSGDIIDFGDNEGTYPFTYGRYGRIESINGNWGEGIHICCELGSAFLFDDGNVSISGGPFQMVKADQLEPTFKLYEAQYWNWGNNGAGAGQGIYYKIGRPVFKLVKLTEKGKVQP